MKQCVVFLFVYKERNKNVPVTLKRKNKHLLKATTIAVASRKANKIRKQTHATSAAAISAATLVVEGPLECASYQQLSSYAHF